MVLRRSTVKLLLNHAQAATKLSGAADPCIRLGFGDVGLFEVASASNLYLQVGQRLLWGLLCYWTFNDKLADLVLGFVKSSSDEFAVLLVCVLGFDWRCGCSCNKGSSIFRVLFL